MKICEPREIPEGTDPSSTHYYESLIDNSTYWNDNTLEVVYKLAKRHMSAYFVHRNVLALLEAIFCPTRHIAIRRDTEQHYWQRYRDVFCKVTKMGFPVIILKALLKVHMGQADILRTGLAVLWKLCIDREFGACTKSTDNDSFLHYRRERKGFHRNGRLPHHLQRHVLLP